MLFFQPFLTCAKCHDAEAGTQLGPDIAQAGKEATAEHLIESVLLPSKVIKKGYEPLTVSTTDGRTVTGLLVEEKNGTLTLIDPAGGKRVTIPAADVDTRTVGTQSLMPDGLVNTLSDRQQFLDLAKYLIEVAEGGPKRAKELRPAQTAFVLPEYEKDIDHAGLIRGLDDKAFKRGEAIYTRVCANCHGTEGPARLAAHLAAVRRPHVQERQRPVQPVPHAHARLQPDGPADVDGAAAEVRRDPLPPRGVPEAAQPDAVREGRRRLPGQAAEGHEGQSARPRRASTRGWRWTTARA